MATSARSRGTPYPSERVGEEMVEQTVGPLQDLIRGSDHKIKRS